MVSSAHIMVGSYDYRLVALSVLIAGLASYSALDLAGRVTAARGVARMVWLTCGAAAMGLGIWSMHYVGMLALELQVPVQYDWPTVLLSLLAAIFASAIALFVASREEMGLPRAAIGSVFMGSAIAGMHYIGMAAMRLPAMCSYSTAIVAVSVSLAIVISFVALLLAFHFRGETTSGGWRKALSAMVMGAAIPAMHYTGMAAARFTAAPGDYGDLSHALSISALGVAGIVVVTFILLGFTVMTSLLDRRFSAQVEQSNKLVTLVLESAPQSIYGIDANGAGTFCNEAFLKLLGFESAEEILGKNVHALIHHTRADGRPYPVTECHIYEAFQTGSTTHVDDEVLWRKDGSSFPAEYWSHPINRKGKVIGSVVTFVDISERKKVEAALRDSEERFRAVFDGATIGIAITDLTTGGLTVNRAYEQMLACAAKEMQNVTVFDELTHPEDRERQRLQFLAMLEGECEHLPMEKRYVLRDGRLVWANVELSMLKNSAGKAQFVLGTAVEVTEQVLAQQDLQEAKRAAEAANEAKSSFLATMSHEIRTPMNGILGMTELVLDTELTTEQREHLGLVRISAESLLSIINDILDFSKIEAGKMELEEIPFDLRESLDETMKSLSIRADQKGLELVYEVLPSVAEAVIGDPGRVRQVLINLVGNAMKFTEHGEVFIGVSEDSHEQDTMTLHFMVRDTGAGIPQEHQQKIFEAFSQADGSMTRKFGGTGLGLAICTRLVAMMGGKLWVESEVGQGSTFHFTVQLGIQREPTRRPAALLPEQLRDLKVLIVDDNYTNRKMLLGILLRWGMNPTAVDGGAPALEALKTAKVAGRPFSMILLDGQMPGMDGFTLAERIQHEPGLVGASIMMLTSAGHLGDAARCRNLGISAYLMKPVRQGELLEAFANVLENRPREKAALVTRHTLREDRKRARLLLVEDNAVNQTLAVRLLEKRGYRVAVTGNGREALARLAQEEFELVLMDVQMPEMDGFEATAAIREGEKSSGRHIPIVAMTANALKGDQERCLAAGMDAYISKPIRTNELFATLEVILNGAAVPVLAEKQKKLV
ncbi:MAG: response regulator [Candidatus Acidiferrales bacterium]